MSRGLYATDASMYQQMPLAAVIPRNRGEVRKALRLCVKHGVPVLPRGGGTSLAGQATASDALVIDASKFMNRVEEVSAEAGYAVVEPGVIRDQLNQHLAESGLMFAPETSTSNRANVGGMIGNNSSGMMSIRYGKTVDHLLGATVFLTDGTELYLGRREEMDVRGEALLDSLLSIIERNRALISERFPKVMGRAGGYMLDEFLGDDPNLAKILAGSEGTLAFLTSAKLRLVPKLRHVAAMAIHYGDLLESLRTVPLIVSHEPLSAEMMDAELIAMARTNPSTAALCDWVAGVPGAVIVVEMEGESPAECMAKLEKLRAELVANGSGYAHVMLNTPDERGKIIEVRKAGLGIMLKMIGDPKPLAFIEDAAVPVERLAEYAEKVLEICREEGVRVISYGHASVGLLHLRPVIDLKSESGREQVARISKRVMPLVREFGGSWAGEHGDGIARGALNEEFWGAEMIAVFREVKRLFDPKGLLNPGKIFATPEVNGPLRYTNAYKETERKSMFKFRDAGGFAGAVEMCNGVGACRKLGSGTMCPSFMATRDEKDSTRGRANALRLAMSGQLGPAALASKELHDVLDLCLECKACKTECPSNIDMAKLKSEFLHGYHEKHGAGLREKLFAFSPDAARRLSGWPANVVNPILRNPLVRRGISKVTGLAVERPLPRYASQTFPAWFERHRTRKLPDGAPRVVLFDDTFTNYHEPHVGKWAVFVLEQLGYRVKLASAGCCCRPLISKGFLTEARVRGERTLRNLASFVEAGLPIIGLEPSCVSALNDDLLDLVKDDRLADTMKGKVRSLEDFLSGEIPRRKLHLKLPGRSKEYLLHGHCHQKALSGSGSVKRVMAAGRAEVNEVDSGCCGMAGSFGYESEHYEISQQIGEYRLFPAVRSCDTESTILASGFSCRHQIKDGTGRNAVHFAEALGRAMKPRC